MITLSNNAKGLALLYQVDEIYGKVSTSDSLLDTALYLGNKLYSEWTPSCLCIRLKCINSSNPHISMLSSEFNAYQSERNESHLSL